MAKTTGKRSTKAKKRISVLAHPGTTAMLARASGCNKPPVTWLQQSDGSWLECFLRPDCTYGNCHAVPASEVPPEIRRRRG